MSEPSAPTVVEPSRNTRLTLWWGLPLLGIVVGWLLKTLAGWALDLPWVPLEGPLELIESLPPLVAAVGGVIVGGIAGALLAHFVESELVHVEVSEHGATIGRAAHAQRVQRADVGAVYVEAKQLVVLGTDTTELVRATFDLSAGDRERLARAFTGHAWPWCPDGDPHADRYRRWVADTPELSDAVNALLAARERAMEREDNADSRRLRRELARYGVVLRDVDGRQHFRTVGDGDPTP